MNKSAPSSFGQSIPGIIYSESSYYDEDYQAGHSSVIIQYNLPENFNLKSEIYERIKLLQKIKSHISEETKSYILKVEKACRKKLSLINEQIIEYSYLLNKMHTLNQIGSQNLLFNISNKTLEPIFYHLKDPFSFYKKQFFIEKFRIPCNLQEAKSFVLKHFPSIKEKFSSIMDITISMNGLYTVVGRADDRVNIYDNETMKLYHQFTGLQGTVLSVAISNDSRYVLAGLIDRNIFLWDLDKKKTLKIFRSKFMQIRKVLFTNDSKYLVCIGEAQGNKFAEVRSLKNYDQTIFVSPHDDWLALHPEVKL